MDLLLNLFQIEHAPGAGAELWLDTTSALWIGAISCVVISVTLYFSLRTLQGLSRPRQALLLGLRLSLMCVVALLLLRPSAVLLSPVKSRERIAVLVDASKSMSIAPQKKGPSRWMNGLHALQEGPLQSLKERFELELYTFGGTLTSIPDLNSLDAALPQEEETDIREALQVLTREGRDLSLGGVVLVSDGIDRGLLRKRWHQEGLGGLRTALEPFSLPIHTYDLSEQDGLVDLAIKDLSYNEFAFLRQPFTVEVTLKSLNLAGTVTKVNLTSGGRLLGSRRVTIPEDGEAFKAQFEINPDRVGKFTYTIATPVLPEEAVAENNRRSFTLKVVRDKIRVLQVAGAPSWDVKFLRRLLKSDPNIDLVSFFILRGPSDRSLFDTGAYSLIEFPYRDLFDKDKDLGSFDVVVFQNFAYGPYLRGQSFRLLTSLADYVREGGGLAMLGGEQAFAAGGYAGTPLEEVLPVKMDRAPSVMSLPIRFQITQQGLRHPVTMLHFNQKVNRENWDRLPRLDGYNPTSPWPDSVVLATVGDSQIPLLAVRQVDRGRTMALTTDTSWYWSFRAAGQGTGSLSYLRFWKNALRWLIGDPDEQQIQVDTDRENYRLGEETIIQVKVAGADYGPVKNARVAVEVRLEETQSNLVTLKGKTTSEGNLTLRYKAERPGPYRIKAKVNAGHQVRGEAETVFTVSEQGPELEDLAGDGAFLAALASASGGVVLTEANVGQLELLSRRERALSQRTVIPLWDRFPPYYLLLALVCGEWGLRRRWGVR